MPNPAFPIMRACFLVLLGLGAQVAHAAADATHVSSMARGVMAVSVQVVATCTASAQKSAGAVASCQDGTPYVLSHEKQFLKVARGIQVLTIRY